MMLQSRIVPALLALAFGLGVAVPAKAGDYASEISAYRRAHGLSAVRLDSRLNAVALLQARAMSASGTVSHSVGGLQAACTFQDATVIKAISGTTTIRK